MGTNVKKFNLDLKKKAAELGEKGDIFFRAVCMEVTRRAILMTPVDTGRLRGGWLVSIDKPDKRVSLAKDKNGAGTLFKADKKTAGMKMGNTCFITNNVEYAGYVEEGTSKRTGKHMLGLAIQEVAHGIGVKT